MKANELLASDKAFFTAREMAVILDCQVKTIRRKIRTGGLKGVEIDGMYRVSRATVEKMMAGKQEG
jgi:excisionase family DNA binding protein